MVWVMILCLINAEPMQVASAAVSIYACKVQCLYQSADTQTYFLSTKSLAVIRMSVLLPQTLVTENKIISLQQALHLPRNLAT